MSSSTTKVRKPVKSDPKVEALYRSRSVEESIRSMIRVMSRVSIIVILILMCVIMEFGYTAYSIENKYSATTVSCWQARRGIVGLESNLFKMYSNPASMSEYKADLESQEDAIRSNLEKIDSIYGKAFESEIKEAYAQLDATMAIADELVAQIESEDTANSPSRITNEFTPVAQKLGAPIISIAEQNITKSSFTVKSLNWKILLVIFLTISLIVMLLKVTAIRREALVSNICTPVDEVRDAMDNMAAGNLDISLEYQATNELGQMSDKVRQTSAELTVIISDISEVLGQLADKNFDVSLEKDYQGMFIGIKDALVRIIASLNDTMTSILKVASDISSESEGIAQVAKELADDAIEEAGTVEELTATIQGVADQVQINADNVRAVSDKSRNSQVIIDSGNQKMEELVGAMEEIRAASSKISEIIGVIQGISEQTNLLALNASIEAARAGDAGKGFAVVATEIGQLANQTNEATHTTEELVNKALGAVSTGGSLVSDTAEILANVVEASGEINALAEEVATASATQADSLRELSAAVGQITESVETTSGMAQQTSAASDQLETLVENLNDMVSAFTLKV